MGKFFVCISILYCVSQGTSMRGNGEETPVQSIWGDLGSNLTLSCGGVVLKSGESAMWVHRGRNTAVSTHVQKDGSLSFSNLRRSDSGLYSCHIESPDESSKTEETYETLVHIVVRTPPLALKNVTVKPYSVFALVMWSGDDTISGGHPISSFQISYRLKNDSKSGWQSCLPEYISPKERQFAIYHLKPNSSYFIQIWANNKLGKGQATVLETRTHGDPQEIELREHWLDGVETFDVRIWIIAVSIVMSTLSLLGVITCCLFYKERNTSIRLIRGRNADGESIELMPNIILNPGYDFQTIELLEADENSNDTTTLRMNNNSVVHPTRV